MKALVPRDTLHQKLSAISGVVSQHTSLPILSNVLIQARDDRLHLTATDLDVTVRVSTGAKIGAEGGLTVPARKFQEVLRELPGEEVTLEKKETRLGVVGGRNRVEILALPEEDYPAVPKVRGGEGVKMDPGLVRDWAELVLFAVSKDESRPVLGGVLWEIDERGFTMVATNGHRLSKLTHPGKFTKPAGMKEMILPPKAVNLLVRLCGTEEGIELLPGESHLLFRGVDYEVYSRLLEGPYPNYQQVIPKDNDKEAVLDRIGFLGAVRRTSLMANLATRRIELDFGKNVLKLAGSMRDVGEARCEVEADYRGEGMRLDFNAGYLEDVLKVIRADKVRMTFKGSDRAVLIGPEGSTTGEEYLSLIMPLRVAETS